MIPLDARKKFLPQVLPLLLKAAYKYCNTPVKIPSKTIRRFMTIEYNRGDTHGKLVVPHYWAKYYHNGRASVRAKNVPLIYYKDPRQDPRIAGGYPINYTQVRRLSAERFRQDRLAGKLIVVNEVGPTTRNYPFFSDTSPQGMQGFKEEAEKVGAEAADSWVQASLRNAKLLNRKISITIGRK